MKERKTHNEMENTAAVTAAATAEAAKVIAQAAAEAARVVAASATEALQASNKQRAEDHDLLIELKTKMDAVKLAIEILTKQDSTYVLKEDFVFWRNLLVSGMLLAIFLGIIMRFIK